MEKIFEKIAKEFNESAENTREDICAAIDAAWANPEGANFLKTLFPEGKPSPELFLYRLAAIAQKTLSDKSTTA